MMFSLLSASIGTESAEAADHNASSIFPVTLMSSLSTLCLLPRAHSVGKSATGIEAIKRSEVSLWYHYCGPCMPLVDWTLAGGNSPRQPTYRNGYSSL